MIVTTINNAVADEQSQVLIKGTSAPYTGVLIPEKQATQLYNDLHTYKSLIDSYEKSITYYKQNEDLMNSQAQILLKQNDRLAETVYKQQNTSNLEKVLWFSLGFLSVGMGIYGVKKTTQ